MDPVKQTELTLLLRQGEKSAYLEVYNDFYGVMYHLSLQYLHDPKIADTDGKAIVSASDGSPIVIEKKHGAGRLISCMIPWFEGATTGISNAALYLFDMIISEVQPVMVEGPPVEYLSSGNESEYTVLISNNSSLPWKGKVSARNITKEYGKCTELLTGEPLRSKLVKNEDAVVELVVPAYDVRAVCWSKQK